jgi:hypothetical protein
MTVSLVTDEVRWFRPGGAPDAVLAWFAGLPGPAGDERRVDEYLELPQIASLGIKLRRGLLEVKRLRLAHGEAAWRGFAGRPARWEKWSFRLTEDDGAARTWTPVEKWRRQRTLRVGGDGAVAPVAPGERVDRGCSVEVTRLDVRATRWWSLGFEATGEEADLRRTLDHAVDYVAGTGPPFELAAADSLDYPAWLSKLLSPAPAVGGP